MSTDVRTAPVTSMAEWKSSRWAAIWRRCLPTFAVLTAWLVLRTMRDRSIAHLQNEAFVTGYSLLAICVLLMLLGVRKRMPTSTWGRLAIWQRAHHYLGLMSVGAYALHAGWPTTGWLESALAIAFWAIAASGLISWYINRTAPKMLRAAGSQVLRQDIPVRKRAIAEAAYQLAMGAAGKSETASLADHYRTELSPFFSSRRTLWYRCRPSGSQRRRLLAGLENIDRYLSPAGCEQRQKMSELVQAKDDLDFQSAIQNRVRFWAACHTWLLGGFVVLTAAHVWTVHQFTSGW